MEVPANEGVLPTTSCGGAIVGVDWISEDRIAVHVRDYVSAGGVIQSLV